MLLYSVNSLWETIMKKIYLQRIGPKDLDSYDLINGTVDVEKIFSHSSSSATLKTFPVFTSRVREVYRRGNYTLKHVRYPSLALEMILSGKMEFQTEQQSQVAGPGTLYIIPPGTTVKSMCHQGKEVRKLCVIMQGENLSGLLITLRLSECRLMRLKEPEVMEEKIRTLKEAIYVRDVENSVRSYHFLLELAALNEESLDSQSPLARAATIMSANFQEDLQIPAVAAASGVSESTLRRLFRAELNCSPLEYLNTIRLNFAVRKLKNSNRRIKEIAQMSGFLSSVRFCTVFREKYQVSPGQFRRNARINGDLPRE